VVGKKRGKKRRKTFKIPLFKREKWRVSGDKRLFRFEFENRKPHIYFNVEGSTVLKVIGSNYAVDFRGENSDLVNLFYLRNSCIQFGEMFSASFQLIIAVSAAFFYINVSCDQKSFLTKPAANDHVGNEIINVRGASTTVYDGETATLHNSRKVSVVQSSWALAASIQYYITTIAGIGLSRGYSGDGLDATTAQLNFASGVAVDASGNIYVADTSNHCIRKVTASTGKITTIAGIGLNKGYSGDGLDATTAKLNVPSGVAVDASGNIYVADTKNHCIRMVTVSTGKITTIAGIGLNSGYSGDGLDATTAKLKEPTGVAVDVLGNIYVADNGNSCIRMVTVSTGKITTIAGIGLSRGYSGDGLDATTAKLNFPIGVAVDVLGNIYVADSSNHCIRKVTVSTGKITTIAGIGLSRGYSGDGLDATTAQLNVPSGVAVDASGNIYVADTSNHCIRKVTASTGEITTIAGIGLSRGYSGDGLDATTAQLNEPYGIAVDVLGNIYVAEISNHCIRKVRIVEPTASPSAAPSVEPTASPSAAPSVEPTASPSAAPSVEPTASPSAAPSVEPTASPSAAPSVEPTASPSAAPSARPAACLSVVPSKKPAASPSLSPTCKKDSPPAKRPRRPTRT
jgi:sugar lactone lactonase YvrE